VTMLNPEHRQLIDALVVLYQAGEKPERDHVKAAVKVILADLSEREPGRSVEVRIPPFAAIQVVAGHTHRRGTPAAVVEMDPETLILLAAGVTQWAEAIESGSLLASGERSDLSRFFPLN
jgi:hypothetical protein